MFTGAHELSLCASVEARRRPLVNVPHRDVEIERQVAGRPKLIDETKTVGPYDAVQVGFSKVGSGDLTDRNVARMPTEKLSELVG